MYKVIVDYMNKDSIMYGTQDLILQTEVESEAEEAVQIMNLYHQYDSMVYASYVEVEEKEPEFKTLSELRKAFLNGAGQ